MLRFDESGSVEHSNRDTACLERDLGDRTTSQDPGSALRRLVVKKENKKENYNMTQKPPNRRRRRSSILISLFGVIVGRANFDLLYLESPLAYCDT